MLEYANLCLVNVRNTNPNKKESKMSFVEDHTEEYYQYGEFKVADIDFIEVNAAEEQYEIYLHNGDIHYFRFTCVLSYKLREDKMIMIVS